MRESQCDADCETQERQQTQPRHLCQTSRELSRVAATVTRTISLQVAMWCLKSMPASKYFVRVADASLVYVKVT